MKSSGLDPDKILKDGVGLDDSKTYNKLGIDTEKVVQCVLAERGLDLLVGSLDNRGSRVASTASAVWSMSGNSGWLCKTINSIPIVGWMVCDSKGNMVGPLKWFFTDMLGISGQTGGLAFVKEYVDGDGE